MKKCSIDNCIGIYKARGLCRTHYSRWLIHGDYEVNLRPKNKLCLINKCNGKHVAKGYCDKHYTRLRITGDPLKVKKNNRPSFRTIEETFFDGVRINSDTECLNWIKHKSHFGHGRLHFGSKYYGAHRFSYEYFIGKIPNGLCVCHKCDNPSCVAPSHLFLGTKADNNKDCYQKGRYRNVPSDNPIKGIDHKNSKLNESDVMLIKEMLIYKISCSNICKLFNVSYGAIHHIKTGRTWNHIKMENKNEFRKV